MRRKRSNKRSLIDSIGNRIIVLSNHIGEATSLLARTVQYLFTSPLEFKNIIKQIVEIGIKSIGVVSLASLFTGMVFAFQIGYVSNMWLGSPSLVGLGVALAMIKELGPVITGLVLSGRVGAQIAAELGTMKVTEQIDALYTLGTNPIKHLYVPRFVACVISVPILVLYADVLGITGGFIIAAKKFGIPPPMFWDEVFDMIRMDAVWHGSIKSFFFALIIVTVSCYQGLSCRGGAEGVGKSTTAAVVISMILILVLDYFLTSFLMTIGIGIG